MILIGNCVSFLAAIFTVLSSWQKTRKKIYGYQAIQCSLMALASIFFLSFSGVSTFILCAIRNYLLSNDDFDKKKCILFLFFITGIGLWANNRGVLGLLPIVTTIIYTIGTFYLKNEISIKLNIILNLILWAIYEGIIMDYVSVIVDVTSAIVAMVSIKKAVILPLHD